MPDPDPPVWLPTQQQVAALMFARAMGELDGEASFGDRPTPAQVEEQIQMAWLLLRPQIDTDVPEKWRPVAAQVVKLQTALLLEPGFWPEQQRDAVRAAWDEWEKLLDRFLAILLEGLQDDRDDGAAGDGEPVASNVPLYSFPVPYGRLAPDDELLHRVRTGRC